MKYVLRSSLILTICIFSGLGLGCRKNGSITDNGATASLYDLNRALALWTMANGGQIPKDVSILTNTPILKNKSLPVAPPGKKLLIDAATLRVVFVDQ
jgi:hypothetical protein